MDSRACGVWDLSSPKSRRAEGPAETVEQPSVAFGALVLWNYPPCSWPPSFTSLALAQPFSNLASLASVVVCKVSGYGCAWHIAMLPFPPP